MVERVKAKDMSKASASSKLGYAIEVLSKPASGLLMLIYSGFQGLLALSHTFRVSLQ